MFCPDAVIVGAASYSHNLDCGIITGALGNGLILNLLVPLVPHNHLSSALHSNRYVPTSDSDDKKL
jgi:hypothetical protein